ncbi:MAG: GntP family permease [Chitinophagaceae bacterium]|nr:GntP family permease [Chitinophagaceae bacterium]
MWTLLLIGIAILVVLISYFKVQPFLSFLFVALFMGLAYGLSGKLLIDAIQKGMGSTLGTILSIILLGAMIGKIIAKSNASIVIADRLVHIFGPKQLPFAFMIIGFIVSLPLFFSVAFLLLTPLVLATAKRQQINPVYLGIPMLASMSITQGFLPPHPAPYYLVTHLPGADMGITLGWGILIAIPAMLLSGWLFGMSLKKIPATPLDFNQESESDNRPSFYISLSIILLPVILIASNSFFNNKWVAFISDPTVALFISLAVALYLLGFKRSVPWSQMQGWMMEAVKDIAPLLLTFAGAGAFKEVLQLMKIGEMVMHFALNNTINPLILSWLIAAMLRVITGSSTVAGITTAGIILPLLTQTGVNPNLLALSIGAGSMVLSHVNDAGFWLYKEYFGVSVKDTLRSWTIMETILALVGLAGVLLLDCVV